VALSSEAVEDRTQACFEGQRGYEVGELLIEVTKVKLAK
jgi:hypothetical protein